MSRSRDKQRRKQRDDGFGLGKNDKDFEQAEARRKQTRAAVIVIFLVAIVAVVVLVLNSNFFYRNMTALRVDGQNFSIADMNFYSSQRGGFDGGIEAAQRNAILHQRATAAGLTLTEEQQEEVDETVRFFREDFQEHMFESSSGFIIANFGRGMNLRVLRERVEFDALARAYEAHFIQSLIDGYSESDLEEFYLENRDHYDRVHFYLYEISFRVETEEEDAEVELDPTNALETAAAVIEATEEDGEEGFFLALQEATGIPVESLESFTFRNETRETSLFRAYGDWLLNDNRTEGDVAYFQGEEVVYVIYFIGVDENRYHTSNVRHILITPEDVDPFDEDMELRDPVEVATEEAAELAIARLRADEIYNQWRAGVATEESFIELVQEYSADYRGEADPGLYPDIDHNTPFVEEFLDWSMDPARRPGDVEIVETLFGFHIMYFVSHSERDLRHTLAANDMSRDAFVNWIEEATAASSWQRTFFSRLVG